MHCSILLLVCEVSNRQVNAIVVQLVARDLAKVELAGSSPVYRSGWGFADIELADSFFSGN